MEIFGVKLELRFKIEIEMRFGHWSLVIGNWQLVIGHRSFGIGNWKFWNVLVSINSKVCGKTRDTLNILEWSGMSWSILECSGVF